MSTSNSKDIEHKNDCKSTVKRGKRPQQMKLETVIAAIDGTGGIVTQIAEKLRCGRHTVYDYIKRFPEVHDAYEAERDKVLDVAEEGLLSLVYERNFDAIRYYLERMGLQRGYGGRNNIAAFNARREKALLQKAFEDTDNLSDAKKLPTLTAIIMNAVVSGGLDADLATKLGNLVGLHAKVLELSDLEARIRALELKNMESSGYGD